ncbi:MAG: SRPBCC domain-containing protein [Acidimicrobiia bacterium]
MSERRTARIERTYDASPAEVWELWTTADGIESWWGPEGFGVEVHDLDVRPGGKMTYSMIAEAAEMKAFMEAQGMPTTTTHDMHFTEVVPYRRLSYRNAVDFVPGVETYNVGTRLELEPHGAGTRLTLILDAMHDDHWTEMSVAGWKQQLDNLAETLKEKTL